MQHIINNAHRPVENKESQMVFRREKASPNDYLRSLNYLRIAYEKGMRPGELGAAAARTRVPMSAVLYGILRPR